ncbi:hypothetical protein [Terriglobus roseus]|uniref:Uncharacterized protein n=1 Tax=Terriglobus roseus TaxID=392734 RepID=A0A1G7M6B9_9BACT|nr:hypothetical protein [Terriglobus roseus]SDF57313.1 hypothetical protein SAMN05444167_2715 [Terriglobus roseus]
MRPRYFRLLPFTLLLSTLAYAQQVTHEKEYQPPALSLTQLMEHDATLSSALMTYARTGDSATFRSVILQQADAGNLGAQLMLGEQFIPRQCTFEPNHDVPDCGRDTASAAQSPNPLGIVRSYEDAAQWLEKASAAGSGEASEVLAQLITRMYANGHATSYTEADAIRLHALARTQGFDVEPISVTCYKVVHGGQGISLGRLPGLIVGDPPEQPFTSDELAALKKLGVSGTLLYGGGSGGGDSMLLTRPQGPLVHVRVLLDHAPEAEVRLPMPAHRDVIYVQQGKGFVAIPADGENLPRYVIVNPVKGPTPQVTVGTQTMDGGVSGGFCTRFP